MKLNVFDMVHFEKMKMNRNFEDVFRFSIKFKKKFVNFPNIFTQMTQSFITIQRFKNYRFFFQITTFFARRAGCNRCINKQIFEFVYIRLILISYRFPQIVKSQNVCECEPRNK